MHQENKPLIIIGTGLAGYHLAKEFRKHNSEQPLVLITQDDGHFYSKPQLSTALMQAKTPQHLIITDCQTMASQLNAQIYPFTTVDSIITEQQVIHCHNENGAHTLHYDQLVLAQGATPNPFPIGDNIKRHFRVNSLLDYRKVMDDAKDFQHITIVGSGLVGTELAHDFTHLNIPISIISPEPYPLYRFVPSSIGHALAQALANKGIDWHTDTHIEEITEDDHHSHLRLANGKSLTTSLLISAIGLTPNVTLAKQTQLTVNHGIVVNEYLQTSNPKIFALGDCAEINGECRYFVAPILACSRALAQTLNGKPTAVQLTPMPIVLKVNSYPITMMLPPVDTAGEWHFETESDGIKAVYKDDDRILGYILTGSCQALRQEVHAQMTTVPA